MTSLSSSAEEFAPLTTTALPSSGGSGSTKERRNDDDDQKHSVNNNYYNHRRRHQNNHFFSSFTQSSQMNSSYSNDNNSGSDSDDIGGCTNYRHANPLRTGKYQGYCTLLDATVSAAGGRVSMHDDWDFSPRNSATDNDNNGSDDDGHFVSFWGRSCCDNTHEDGDDSSSSSQSCDRKQQQHDLLDDRVETTVRPVPLLYRQYQGGTTTTTNSFSINKDANNFGSWFQRELGLNGRNRKLYDDDNHHHDRGRLIVDNSDSSSNNNRRNDKQDEAFARGWGFGRRRSRQTNSTLLDEEFGNNPSHTAANGDREEYVLYSEPSVDDDSAQDSNTEDADKIGHAMPSPAKQRALSPKLNNSNPNNICNDRNRGGEGLLSLPIVRPFLRRSHQGFSDKAHEFNSNDEVEDDGSDECINSPSKEDRAAVMKSISDGITGTKNNNPILFISTTTLDTSKDELVGAPNSPPNLLERIFLTRFIQMPNRNNDKALLIQLHDLLRKEDWSLATELLESKPTLAQKWHSVQRLYGGKFDAEALPIHSACALCPPASFIQTLATMYPEGLLKKEKAFGRIPLHIACRSLADSSVIRVLCEMEPRSVVERDGLKRVALHYLIKNYNTFGDDEDGYVDENKDDESCANESTDKQLECDKAADGIVALKLLVETDIACVKVADHRGWIPLHVACSSSARQGMLRVINMLIDWWPESVYAKTEKNSDVFACVEMAGKHHVTKEKVVALLKRARHELANSDANDENEEYSSASAIDIDDNVEKNAENIVPVKTGTLEASASVD
jgi:hypothetical protein